MTADRSENAVPPPVRSSRPNRHTRRWLPYVGAVLLVGLIVAGLWPQPVPVEMVSVTTGKLRTTVNEEGETRIKQRFAIAAPITGQLRRIEFKAGAEVRQGQTVLAVIDPVSPVLLDARTRLMAEARRDTATATRERARADHVFAVSELNRIRKLREERIVSLQDLEAAEWREAAAAKELSAADSALRQAEAELADFQGDRSGAGGSTNAPVEVKAPVSGRVLRVLQESSRVVTAGTPLVEIGDPTDLEIVIEVLSRDGATIVPGTPVELEQWGGAQPLAARVRLVEPAAYTKISALGVEEQRVNVIADLLAPVEERPGLGDDFRVEARIIVWEADGVLKAPTGALFRRGNQWFAFMVQDGRARLRALKIGQSSDREAQVLEGLKEGDTLILYPGDRVRDGLRVKAITI